MINLLFRQFTESRSAPVDEILAQICQYVSKCISITDTLQFSTEIFSIY